VVRGKLMLWWELVVRRELVLTLSRYVMAVMLVVVAGRSRIRRTKTVVVVVIVFVVV
jgi:hypothetical protein